MFCCQCDMKEIDNLISLSRLSTSLLYLKYSLVQQPGPKHSDPVCADYSVVPSLQIQGLYCLTVQVEGHRLVLHAVGYPVPSEKQSVRIK